ncbi:MAG: NAD-glutamate dehydrogenase [Hyphomicrobiaceae bacterium]
MVGSRSRLSHRGLGACQGPAGEECRHCTCGCKGGFPKKLPRNGTREEIQAEGVAAYSTFISALLDITDNVQDDKVVPPARVVRHDGDDPYLVVAADKGTATFSDIANAIAIKRDFWLGDAFASGGSTGYDHKGMGITARGGWECVKRHFRELDWDIQSTPFTVIGVGDMSGDVFGNGMLLSPVTRLVAAFDHRHIFLDPSPDPAVSFAERRRLFDMSRSSWADYDTSKLSQGGGIFPRSAKSIPLSGEVRTLLKVDVAEMAPNDLMRAILQVHADLLWFGGIGTYIRASGEADGDVGDRGNDAIRISASELNVRVVGEGANLGMTQRGRVEAGDRGIKLNTDFIDNSAGVNTSDQEVNIKIALRPAVTAGRLDMASRNALLASMTDDVAAGVLRNNYQQSLTLSLAERRGVRDMGALGRLMTVLEARGLIDRRLESLPGPNTVAERARAGKALTRPELAVIMSYTKIALLHDLLASEVPDDPYLDHLLHNYFPSSLRARFAQDIARHHLKREIVATTLTNGVINRLGLHVPLALSEASGRPIADVALAYMAARRALGLADLWQRVDALDGRIAGGAQLEIYEYIREALVVATRDILSDGVGGQPLEVTVDQLAAGVKSVREASADLTTSWIAASAKELYARFLDVGVPADLTADLGALALLRRSAGIVGTAKQAGADVVTAARCQLTLSEIFSVDRLADRAAALAPTDDYERLAGAGAIGGLGNSLRRLAVACLAHGPVAKGDDVRAWCDGIGDIARQTRADLTEIASGREMSVARLSVASARLAVLADAVRVGQGG